MFINAVADWVQTNALFTGLLGAIVGAAAAAKYDRNKEEKNRKEKTKAYLVYWKEELDYNKKVLIRMRGFVGGPLIPNIWDPILALSRHLKSTAWDSILKEGIFSDLSLEDSPVFRITNRSILDVCSEIDYRVANLDRISYWEAHDHYLNNPQPASAQVFYDQSTLELEQRIGLSIEYIDEALKKIENLL